MVKVTNRVMFDTSLDDLKHRLRKRGFRVRVFRDKRAEGLSIKVQRLDPDDCPCCGWEEVDDSQLRFFADAFKRNRYWFYNDGNGEKEG